MEEDHKLGLVHVYTGDGKGKSTAAFGLALRAAGCGLRVGVVQFMKTGHYGENESFDRLGIVWHAFGHPGFVDPHNPRAVDIDLAHQALACATEMLESCDLLVLDEVCNAVFFGLLTNDEVLDFVAQKPPHLELVLTGRNASEELCAQAAYVTDMHLRKHPYLTNETPARRGIEY